MQKILNWMLAATLVCGASVMTSCSSNDDNPAPQSNIAEKIIGKWMVKELDGEPCPTNWKTVLTFVSPTKAYGSLSDFSTPMWNVKVLADVKIDGNKVNVINTDGNIRQVLDCTILSITDKDLLMEIESISDGVMKWTALRKKADGSTYTATFEMTKVK